MRAENKFESICTMASSEFVLPLCIACAMLVLPLCIAIAMFECSTETFGLGSGLNIVESHHVSY